jgi:hypothetical protein
VRHSEFDERWYASRRPSLVSALPPHGNGRGYTSIYFGENQLSRNLISLSPLPTAHPRSFQPSPVRASSACYRAFTLAMGRSSRFGSTPSDSDALFRLAFASAPPPRLNLAAESNSQTHYAKGTPSDTQRLLFEIVLRLLVSVRFQELFHSPHWGTFHLSLTVLVHYRS